MLHSFLAADSDTTEGVEEPILHLLWGLVDTFFCYNFPKPEPIWMKSGI